MQNLLSRHGVVARIEAALKMLFSKDFNLFQTGLHERCIAHRLAVYLEEVFEEWDVDCEYNRNGEWPKQIPLQTACIRQLRKTGRVFPDIIVHQRGPGGPNLLAIEVKRQRQPGRDCDLEKLCGYVSAVSYSYGLYLCLSDSQRRTARHRTTPFSGGAAALRRDIVLKRKPLACWCC